jgi:hypothetical protein
MGKPVEVNPDKFLAELLKDGPVSVADIEAAGKQVKLSMRTLERAKTRIGRDKIKGVRLGKRWGWRLLQQPQPAATPARGTCAGRITSAQQGTPLWAHLAAARAGVTLQPNPVLFRYQPTSSTSSPRSRTARGGLQPEDGQGDRLRKVD